MVGAAVFLQLVGGDVFAGACEHLHCRSTRYWKKWPFPRPEAILAGVRHMFGLKGSAP